MTYPLGLQLRGRRVLVVGGGPVAARRLQALLDDGALVTVGEGPGHVRDTELALVESGVLDALDQAELPFADLNYEDVVWRRNRGKRCSLDGFYFPRSVAEADLIVSLPKMKTHRGAAKRFKRTGTGKLRRRQANKNHILEKKAPKRKRQLRRTAIVSKADEKNLRDLGV